MTESPPAHRRRGPSAFESVATFAIVAALLFFGAGIFVPLVLSILLAFALNPLVSWMSRRLRIPDAVAVVLAVLIAVAILIAFSAMAGLQIANLVQELPRYREIVQAKVEGLQSQFGGLVWFDQLTSMAEGLGQRLENDNAPPPGQMRPIPVSISNEIGPLAVLTSVMGSVVGPIATGAIVIVFLVFLLLGRADMQERFIRLVSGGRYSRTNLAITDASDRVGRYLVIQLAVNSTYGLIFGTGLWLIGVPSAALWGLLIVLFRYIPFVGALMVAIVPFVLAFAIDPGWNMLLLTLGLFLVIDLTTANVIEPRLYGSSTGVSPIAILLSAMFWATLWGPVGLILATPMTVCLVVIGRHLPQFQFLETLLGSEPVLTPAERLYQRMLKGAAEDAIELSEAYIEEHDSAAWRRQMLLPALRLANIELSDRPESVPQRRLLANMLDTVFTTVIDHEWRDDAPIVLIGGSTEIDEAAARLMALELADANMPASVLPPGAIRQDSIGRLELDHARIVMLVFMGTDIRVQSRYVARRIRRMYPDMFIGVCVLNDFGGAETADLLHVDAVYRDIDSAAEAIAGRSAPVLPEMRPASQLFAGLGRGDDELGRELDAIAERFGVPVALINLAADPRHLEDADAARLTLLVAEQKAPVVVHSSARHPSVGDNAYLITNGIDFYAAVPLVLPDGSVPGVLALLDYDAHSFNDEEMARLQREAASLIERFA